MKRIYLFTIASILVFGMISCNILSPDEDNGFEDFRFVPGELLVELEDDYTLDELDSLLAECEIERRGTFFPAELILVQEGKEKDWAELLDKEDMIRSALLNRFGDGYILVEKDEFPYIKNDLLYVWTVYNGCGPGRDFTLEYMKTGSSSFEIWLFKENVEECGAVFQDKGRPFQIPDEVKDAQSIQLIKPINDRIDLRD